MSMYDSQGSSPSVDMSEPPSPVPSSSQTPTHHPYSNGYHNVHVDFSSYGNGHTYNFVSANMQSHPTQCRSPADDTQFIKRPLNAYMMWTRQERKKIIAKDSSLKMNEISRLMGDKWKKLTEKEKKPFFEMARQSKLEHKKVLKENPNLVYHPQRKKLSKGFVKQEESPASMDVASDTATTPGSVVVSTPTHSVARTPRINGYSNTPIQQAVPQAQVMAPSAGTVLVAQALGMRTPLQVQSAPQGTPISFTIQTAQPVQRTVYAAKQAPTNMQHNGTVNQNTPATMNQMLDLYYTSLCQPAFPQPGETNTMAPPQYYLDQYQQLHYQAMASQHYSHQNQHGVYQAM